MRENCASECCYKGGGGAETGFVRILEADAEIDEVVRGGGGGEG